MEIVFFILAGIAGGILGGMGMGGGTLLIPILTLFLDVPQHSAQMINLIAFIPMSVFALAVHAKKKLIKWQNLLYVIVPAMVSSAFSSLLAAHADTELLRKFFGLFLVILGISYLIKLIFFQKQKI